MIMVKKCKVAIFFCQQHAVHADLALEIFRHLQVPSKYGLYEPALVHTGPSEVDFRYNVAIVEQRDFDVFVVLGELFSVILNRLYRSNKRFETVFVGVTDPVHCGLVQSLELPGGPMTGVSIAIDSATAFAEKIALFYPFISRLVIPYVPTCLGGRLAERGQLAAAYLRAGGMSVILEPISAAEETEAAVAKHIEAVDGILLLEGCLSTMAIPEVARLAWRHRKAFFANNGSAGLLAGATASYGRPLGDLILATVRQVHMHWEARCPMAAIPVISLPDNRFFTVNEPWLRHIGDVEALVQKLSKCPDVEIVRVWPNNPAKPRG